MREGTSVVEPLELTVIKTDIFCANAFRAALSENMERSVMIHLTWPFLVITNEMISEMRKPFKISDLDKSQASSNPVGFAISARQ